MLMRSFRRLLLSLWLIILITGGGGLLFALRPLSLTGGPVIDFSIPFGSSLRTSSLLMSEAGLGFEPWQFTLLARVLGKATAIKAGSYEVAQGITPWGLLDKLTRGDVSQGELQFIEGMNFRQLRTAINTHPDLTHDTVTLSDADLLAYLEISEKHPEGLFFPDSYLFDKKSSDIEVYKRAYRAMQKQLAMEWQHRSDGFPLKTPYEALTLASIVEKETGKPEDRPLVAAVFLNRLRLGMLLQTDPTVIYGLGPKYDGKIYKRDLLRDTPYNTYVRPGLPPSPIAMPGKAALHAALHPAHTDKLYFVARGDGSSEFSRSLEDHHRAVVKYQKGKSP